jgi:hypothetical protein
MLMARLEARINATLRKMKAGMRTNQKRMEAKTLANTRVNQI